MPDTPVVHTGQAQVAVMSLDAEVAHVMDSPAFRARLLEFAKEMRALLAAPGDPPSPRFVLAAVCGAKCAYVSVRRDDEKEEAVGNDLKAALAAALQGGGAPLAVFRGRHGTPLALRVEVGPVAAVLRQQVAGLILSGAFRA